LRCRVAGLEHPRLICFDPAFTFTSTFQVLEFTSAFVLVALLLACYPEVRRFGRFLRFIDAGLVSRRSGLVQMPRFLPLLPHHPKDYSYQLHCLHFLPPNPPLFGFLQLVVPSFQNDFAC